MTTYYKAVKSDGFDFATGTIDYGKAAKSRSKLVKHPNPIEGETNAAHYLSVATVATDCTGFSWRNPDGCRLFEVEAVGPVWEPGNYPNKRAVAELRILRELPAWQVFGPEGQHIVALIDRFTALTAPERSKLSAAYAANYDAFRRAQYAVADDGRAGRAGLGAARGALFDRLRDWDWDDDSGAAYGAALALLCRPLGDVFTQNEYDTLSRAWRTTIGPIHPDDKAVK